MSVSGCMMSDMWLDGRSGVAVSFRSERGSDAHLTVQYDQRQAERRVSSGFEPAKALVRGLPLPRPPSFRAHLERLPVLRPIRGVGQVPLAGTRVARPLIDWLQLGRTRVGRRVATGAWHVLPLSDVFRM